MPTITWSTTNNDAYDCQEITLQKLNQSGGGGGGGSGGISHGAVDPVAAPANTTIDNIYINTVTPSTWLWPAGGVSWLQIV